MYLRSLQCCMRVLLPAPRLLERAAFKKAFAGGVGRFEFCERRAAQVGGFPFGWGWPVELTCYCLMVRGSVSLKLRVDSAGKTTSFSPV
jgi:hypothetical protein